MRLRPPLSRFFARELTAGRSTRRARNRLRVVFDTLEDRTVPAVSLFGIPDWDSQGPGPIINGQVENIASTGPGANPVIGASTPSRRTQRWPMLLTWAR